ncbi:YmfQ family protein [Enterobacter asburiae]
MTRDDYFNLLALLLPPVTYDPTGVVLGAELQADARQMVLAEQVVADLLSAIDPQTATVTLTDWERVYALVPGDTDTLQQRRDRVMAALAETGGLSREYFIHLARVMGYTITIDEPEAPMWRWLVNVQGTPERTWYFRVGESSVGDRLEESGDPGLEEMFRRLKPAHTECVFTYTEGHKK